MGKLGRAIGKGDDNNRYCQPAEQSRLHVAGKQDLGRVHEASKPQHQQSQTWNHPALKPGSLGLVKQPTDQGIGNGICKPTGHKHEPHHSQGQPKAVRVEGGGEQVERQRGKGQNKSRQAVECRIKLKLKTPWHRSGCAAGAGYG